MNDYNKQAEDLATKLGIKLTVKNLRYAQFFDNDKNPRNIFKLRLSRGRKSYTFEFGQSIAEGDKAPTMYDVLACLQKYDIGSFEDFCSEFGYDEDSRAAEKTYKAVLKEYEAMSRLFTETELEQLQEIQ